MKLNLGEKIQNNEVTNGTDTLYLSNKIPLLLIIELQAEAQKIQDMDLKNTEEVVETFKNLYSFIKKIFYKGNDKKKVDEFVDDLNMDDIKKVLEFVSNTVKNTIPDAKKKSSKRLQK